MSADPVKEALAGATESVEAAKAWMVDQAQQLRASAPGLREDAKVADIISARNPGWSYMAAQPAVHRATADRCELVAAGLENLLSALQAAEAENERLRLAHLRPGVMRCAKCEFRLIRNVLFAQSGNIGAGTSETEPCPNGCGPLWPVTWQDECQAADKLWDQQFERAEAAEAERDAAREGLLSAAKYLVRLENALLKDDLDMRLDFPGEPGPSSFATDLVPSFDAVAYEIEFCAARTLTPENSHAE